MSRSTWSLFVVGALSLLLHTGCRETSEHATAHETSATPATAFSSVVLFVMINSLAYFLSGAGFWSPEVGAASPSSLGMCLSTRARWSIAMPSLPTSA